MVKLDLSSICLRFSDLDPEIILKVCLNSKCCSSWLSPSKDDFMQKYCFLSLNLVLCVILLLTLDLGRNGSEGKIPKLRNGSELKNYV